MKSGKQTRSGFHGRAHTHDFLTNMKISKYIHSCLLIEDQGKTILVDPGKYTYREHALNLKEIDKLDFLLITHKHGDHMSIPFIKEIIHTFPTVTLISNKNVKETLREENIAVATEGNAYIKLETLKHESSFDKGTPENTIFTLFERFIHPGDNIEYKNLAEIMALPVDCGMWGKVTVAVERLANLQPKYILPIHDYRLKDDIRKDVYKRIGTYFKDFNSIFLPIESGETISL